MAKPVKVVHWYLLDNNGRRTKRRFTSKKSMLSFAAKNPNARLKEYVVGWHAKVWNNRTKKQDFKTFTKKAEADAWINSTKTAIKEGRKKDHRQLQKISCSELIDKYLEEIKDLVARGKQSPYTLNNKQKSAIPLKDFLGDYFLSELSDQLIYDYGKARAKTIEAGTIRKELSLLSHAINISSTAFKISGLENWVSKAKPTMKSQHLIGTDNERSRRLYPDEEEAILNTKTRSVYCPAAFGFSAETAIRRSELCSASRFQIIYDVVSVEGKSIFKTESFIRAYKFHLQNPEYNIRSRINRYNRYYLPEKNILHISPGQSKTGVARDIYLSDKAIKFINSVPPSTCGRLFPLSPDSFTGWLNRILKKHPQIVDLHWHDLRHEGTTRYFERGWGIEEVQLSTGHADLDSLQRYIEKTTADVIQTRELTKKRG